LVEPGRQAFVVATNGKRAKWPSFGHSAIKHAPDAGSPQIKSLRKHIKCRSDQFLRFLADLPVKLRVVVGIHAALEDDCLIGAIKEPCRDAQRSNLIPRIPRITELTLRLMPALRSKRLPVI
jgi:hypothetical protein